MTEWLIYPLLGLLAGLLAGLLGVGGGLLLVAGLVWLLPMQGVPADVAMHSALATSLASIVLTGLSSARAHHRRGSVLWPTVAWLVPGLLLGAGIGSLLATRIPDAWLRMGVSSYCLLAAAQLWFDWPRSRPLRPDAPRGPGYSLAGTGIGAVSAFVGIGGGSMTVPLLVWRGVSPVCAIGTSSACGVAIAVASTVGYASAQPAVAMPEGSIGYIFMPAALGVAVTALFAAPWGAALAHRLSGLVLKRLFAGFLLLIGFTFWQ